MRDWITCEWFVCFFNRNNFFVIKFMIMNNYKLYLNEILNHCLKKENNFYKNQLSIELKYEIIVIIIDSKFYLIWGYLWTINNCNVWNSQSSLSFYSTSSWTMGWSSNTIGTCYGSINWNDAWIPTTTWSIKWSKKFENPPPQKTRFDLFFHRKN